MKKTFEIIIPIRTVSESNCSEHWRKKHQRHKFQKQWIWATLHQENPNVSTPCHIVLTRIAPRSLDYDNLVSSFKWIFDEICNYINPGLQAGRADGIGGISTQYLQLKGKPKEYSVKIEIFQ